MIMGLTFEMSDQRTNIFPTIAAPNATHTTVSVATIVRDRMASSGIELPWLVLPNGNCFCCGPPRPFEVSSTPASAVGPEYLPKYVVGNVCVTAVLNDSSSAVVDMNTSAAPGAGTGMGQPGNM